MKKGLLYFIITIAIIFLWQHFGSSNYRVRLLVSTPLLCFDYFKENISDLFKATFVTFYESFFGLLIATLFAFLLMIICFLYRGFYKFILPIVLSTQVIPLITLAPFFIMWLGIGVESKIALSAIISFYPIFVNFSTGYNSIPNSIHELLDIYKSSTRFKIFNVFFPLSTPNIFTGLKISATLSTIGAIVAEFSGAEIGIGRNLLLTSMRIEPELMIISIFLSTIIGCTLYCIIYCLEMFIGKWYTNEKHV